MEQELILDETQLKTCRCGYHKHHHRVIPCCRYSWFGMLRMLIGVTAYPEEVYYQCEKCEEVLDRTTDLEVRRLHV